MPLFSRRETTEEAYQRTTVTPQQDQLAAEIAAKVEASTKSRWRDRATPEQQARIGYDRTHPKHPRYGHT